MIERERDAYSIADVAFVVLVVGHELAGSFDIAVVDLVMEETVHRHNHRFLHLVRDYHPHHRLHCNPRSLEIKKNSTLGSLGPVWKL